MLRRQIIAVGLVWCALFGVPVPGLAQDGTGRVEGLVRDSRARPIPNARVQIVVGPVLQTVRTNNDGRYRLEGLPADLYQILFSKGGYNSALRPEVRVTAGQATALNVSLEWSDPNTGALEALVRDRTGAPIQNAQVTLLSNLTPLTTVLTDEVGSVVIARLANGSYNLQVARPGFLDGFTRNLLVRAGQLTTAEVRLNTDLSAVGRIQGSVRNPDNLPVQNARVRIISGPTRRDTVTNTEGRYELRELLPGRPYVLEAAAAGFSATTIQDVAVNARALTVVEFTLVPNQTGQGAITGRIRNERGEPVPFAVVDITAGPALGRQVVANRDGVYTFQDLPPAVNYAVNARLTGFSPAGRTNLVVEAGRTTNVDLVLRSVADRPGAITGTITDAGNGRVLNAVQVEVVEGPSAGLSTLSNAAGQYTLEGIIPGRGYLLRFTLDGYNILTIPFLNVASGTTLTVSARLVPRVVAAGVINGVVRTPEGNPIVEARVTLFSGPSAPLAVVTDGEGRYAFRNLIPGTYALRVERAGFRTAERTRLEVRNDRALEVNVGLARDNSVGSMAGIVQDLGRRRVANAQVRLFLNGQQVVQVRSDARGQFRAEGLTPGIYVVEATAAGFNAGRLTNVVVTANRTVSVTVTLLR